MARQRKIKPGYNDSAAIVRLSHSARLLDICLWPHLDGNGMIENSASSIKSKVFPREDITIAQVTILLQELLRAGRIFTLDVDGKSWLYRKDFRKEQKVYTDEPRICSINPEVLDSFDRANNLPQAHVLEVDGQRQLFATSPSSSTSTSTSPSPSGSNLSVGAKQRDESGRPDPLPISSAPPPTWWTEWKKKLKGA